LASEQKIPTSGDHATHVHGPDDTEVSAFHVTPSKDSLILVEVPLDATAARVPILDAHATDSHRPSFIVSFDHVSVGGPLVVVVVGVIG
jgi:hypothetical protein